MMMTALHVDNSRLAGMVRDTTIDATFLDRWEVPEIWLEYVRNLCRKELWAHYYFWEAFQVLKLLDISPLSSLEGKRILEPGCASGIIGVLLALKGAHITYLDYSMGELQRAFLAASNLNILANTQFIQADLLHMPMLESQFDLVWNDGVVEHFDDPVQPILKMAFCAKPGGQVLVTTPARYTPHTAFIRAWRRYRGAFRRFDGWGREKSYTESELAVFLEQAGLVDIRTNTCNVRRSFLDDYLVLPYLERLLGKANIYKLINCLDRAEMKYPRLKHFGFVAAAIGLKP